ncbi:hypothetical protein BLOT_013677 [Blomia tropicalis]|nr:hypothetical protein BLOT_013677 [Blomia tropicalis]
MTSNVFPTNGTIIGQCKLRSHSIYRPKPELKLVCVGAYISSTNEFDESCLVLQLSFVEFPIAQKIVEHKRNIHRYAPIGVNGPIGSPIGWSMDDHEQTESSNLNSTE